MGDDPLGELLRIAAGDPSARGEFYRVLLESTVYVLTPEVPDEARHTTLDAGAEVRLVTIADREGNRVLPVFTSLEELGRGPAEGHGYLGLRGIDLFRTIAGSRAILNAFSEYGKLFTEHETAGLADGSIFQATAASTVCRDTEVLIGEPADPPVELIDGLRHLFEKYRSVARSWLVLMHNPQDGQPPHPLVLIDAEPFHEQLMHDAGIVARSTAPPDLPVDFIRFEDNELCRGIATGREPFYRRVASGA